MKTNSFHLRFGCFQMLVALAMPLAVLRADATLAVASIYGDHMVLQREMKLPVWGTGKAGSEVTVTFVNQSKTAEVNSAGQWRVVLDAMQASSTPRRINISDGSSKVVFQDVLVGEVWLCAGQSNMQFKLSSCENAEAEIAAANHAELRLNGGQGWNISSPESVSAFSGVAYYFGRKLNTEMGIPVGLIARALGGTPVEWWTPADKLERVDFAKAAMANPSKEWEKYEKAVTQWREKVKTQGRRVAGKKPVAVGLASEGVLNSIYAPGKVGSLYAQHLAPMAGFAIRGAIWYQGERNSKAGVDASKAYRSLLANMITSWREEWGQGDFAFLAVQLPTFSGGGESWGIVQEAQAAAVGDVPNAGYIDIRDQPDGGLHPKNKKPVGERLAALAIEKFVK